MAANKFATFIHRKTNRITLVLVYAFLEWSLIFFILLNSLFFYFILRFADYFGLKRPCLFCSRLDRFFDASGNSPSHKDLLCDDHALDISKAQSFDYSHLKPVEESKNYLGEFPKDLFDRPPRCLEKIGSSLCTPIEPDLGIISYPIGDETQIYNGRKFPIQKPRSIFIFEEEENLRSVNLNDSQEPKEQETEEKKLLSENTVIEIVQQSPGKIEEEEEEEVSSDATVDDNDDKDEEFSCYVSSFDCNKQVTADKEEEHKVDLAMEVETTEPTQKNFEFYIDDGECHLIPVEFYKPSEEVREISDVNGDFILDFGAEPYFTAEKEEISTFASPGELKPEDVVTNLGASTDDLLQMQNDDEETDAEVSIGTEIPDHEQIGDNSSQQLNLDNDDGDDHEEGTLVFRTITNINEERFLETPGSMESLHNLHNAMVHLEQRESVIESLENNEYHEGLLTVDKLKLELQEERKALNALYEELEEERSASAVAANETMAMINRLQEEKAAMQMEALQYQRMMEEQAEFDQEALQLLNELMVNREKENAELEKELEVYRKKLKEYEAKEKMGMLRRRMRDSSVDSYRNNGDLDEHDGELQQKNIKGVSDYKYGENGVENTPVDIVLSLDDCLDDYEGERLSILGRLKFLEEKLSALNDEENEEEEVITLEKNGSINGNVNYHGKETNGKHRVIKSKRLLPLFDAVDGEMENGLSNGNHHENGTDESENGTIVTVKEEVDELYERLEALEADREFLRHCVGSLKKGDKGVHLLHEILQHLRDLKNIDLIAVRENENMIF